MSTQHGRPGEQYGGCAIGGSHFELAQAKLSLSTSRASTCVLVQNHCVGQSDSSTPAQDGGELFEQCRRQGEQSKTGKGETVSQGQDGMTSWRLAVQRKPYTRYTMLAVEETGSSAIIGIHDMGLGGIVLAAL